MKPKQLQSWNESKTQIAIEFKTSEELTIEELVPSESFVQLCQEIAHYYTSSTQKLTLKASQAGYLTWKHKVLSASKQFQLCAVISLSKQGQLQQEQDTRHLRIGELGYKITSTFSITKWVVSQGQQVTKAQLLGHYLDLQDNEDFQLISPVDGVIQHLAPTQKPFDDSQILAQIQLSDCKHAKIEQGKCIYCHKPIRQKLDADCFPDMSLPESTKHKIGQELARELISHKKLILVLDLDQTILHTIKADRAIDVAQYTHTHNQALKQLIEQQLALPVDDLDQHVNNCHHHKYHVKESLFDWPSDPKSKFITKFRPYFEQFYQAIHDKFDIYIYTKACKNYSRQIIQFIRTFIPDFNFKKLISRDDTQDINYKYLTRLFSENTLYHMILILDDNHKVWNQYKKQYISTKPFVYFQENLNVKDQQGLSTQIEKEIKLENKNDHYLLKAKDIFISIYEEFWLEVEKQKGSKQEIEVIREQNISVGDIYQKMKEKILKDTNIYFSISEQMPENIKYLLDVELKDKAKNMGASITLKFDEEFDGIIVTSELRKVRSITTAQQKGIRILHYNWILDCEYYLQRVEMECYDLVKRTKEQVEKECDEYLKRRMFGLDQ